MKLWLNKWITVILLSSFFNIPIFAAGSLPRELNKLEDAIENLTNAIENQSLWFSGPRKLFSSLTNQPEPRRERRARGERRRSSSGAHSEATIKANDFLRNTKQGLRTLKTL